MIEDKQNQFLTTDNILCEGDEFFIIQKQKDPNSQIQLDLVCFNLKDPHKIYQIQLPSFQNNSIYEQKFQNLSNLIDYMKDPQVIEIRSQQNSIYVKIPTGKRRFESSDTIILTLKLIEKGKVQIIKQIKDNLSKILLKCENNPQDLNPETTKNILAGLTKNFIQICNHIQNKQKNIQNVKNKINLNNNDIFRQKIINLKNQNFKYFLKHNNQIKKINEKMRKIQSSINQDYLFQKVCKKIENQKQPVSSHFFQAIKNQTLVQVQKIKNDLNKHQKIIFEQISKQLSQFKESLKFNIQKNILQIDLREKGLPQKSNQIEIISVQQIQPLKANIIRDQQLKVQTKIELREKNMKKLQKLKKQEILNQELSDIFDFQYEKNFFKKIKKNNKLSKLFFRKPYILQNEKRIMEIKFRIIKSISDELNVGLVYLNEESNEIQYIIKTNGKMFYEINKILEKQIKMRIQTKQDKFEEGDIVKFALNQQNMVLQLYVNDTSIYQNHLPSFKDPNNKLIISPYSQMTMKGQMIEIMK